MARPEGVRIVRPDGTEVPCELVHNGYDEDQNMDSWTIVGVTYRPGMDRLKVDVFPARTGLSFEATLDESVVDDGHNGDHHQQDQHR